MSTKISLYFKRFRINIDSLKEETYIAYIEYEGVR
jgi:hypothetical protein